MKKIRSSAAILIGVLGILLGSSNIMHAAEKEIYIAGLSEWPLSYYDNTQETYCGVLPELLETVSEQTDISFHYIQANTEAEYKHMAKNVQVDTVWMNELTDAERAELGLTKGAIYIDFVEKENQRRIVLYYTKSMEPQCIAELEKGFSTVTHEYLQGLLLKHSATYIEGSLLPQETLYVIIIGIIICVISVIIISLRARRRYVRRQEEERNRLPDITDFRAFYEGFVKEKKHINYAIVKMSFGLHLVRKMYGHTDADETFKMIVALLKNHITNENEILADAGNHQLILLLRCVDEQQLRERVLHMQEEVEKEFAALQKPYFLEIHAGVYRLSEMNEGIEEAEIKSEIALEYARNNAEFFALYNRNTHKKVLAEYEMELEAEHALENHEFTIYLQPLIELKTGKINGAETFVRWKHPTRGMLTPGDFLSVMKRKRLLGRMNMEVYRQGCRVLRDEIEKGRKLRMLFHFTIDNVEDKNFAENLEAVAEQYGIDRRQIMIQLDEMLDYGYESVLQENTLKLKEYGFYICMDGLELERAFLQYLQGNIDGVKFRYGVVKHLDRPGAKETFAKAVTLCESMNLEMICAGVENEIQKQIVTEVGCSMASGFYFYYPMEPDVFHEIVDECHA